MNTINSDLIRRWTIFIGVFQILFGCIVGFIPPTAVIWFRGIVMAHIEFTANGVMMVVLALLLKEMSLTNIQKVVWFIALQLGTWCNGTSGIIMAISGKSAPLLPNINSTNPPPFGVGNSVATALLGVTGISCIIALSLSLLGLYKGLFKNPADR